jgi:predicted double-glycine peptidase
VAAAFAASMPACARITSMRDLRDAGVVRQRFDYSCGSASLATLLTYGLNEPVEERQLLRDVLAPMSADELEALKRKGLSLHDLQRLAERRGYRAAGFRLHHGELAKLARPVIVHVKPGGYEHFAILKGVRGDRVYLADPSLGNVRMPLYRFLEMWADASGRGVLFAVDRADRSWPERYALEIPESGGAVSSLISTERLFDSAKPFPLGASLPAR